MFLGRREADIADSVQQEAELFLAKGVKISTLKRWTLRGVETEVQ